MAKAPATTTPSTKTYARNKRSFVTLPSANKVHDLHLRPCIHTGGCPIALLHDDAIQFDGDAIGLDIQRVQQVQHGLAPRDGGAFSVDGDYNAGGFG
jgi:hypothetical protein